MLADTDPDRTGLAVVFVDAGGPDRPVGVRTNMWNSVRKNVARAAHQVPDAIARRVPERMAAARWDWWFPQSRAGSPAFQRLRCIRPTGPADDRWDTVGLLDPADLLAPAGYDTDTSAATAVANCAALLGVPHWLRERHPAFDFDQVLRRQAGVTATPKLLYLDRKTMRRTRTERINDRGPGQPRRARDLDRVD
jgi:hypothetical protein